MRFFLIALVSMSFTACGTAEAKEGFLPENNLWMEDGFAANDMTEATFNSIIQTMQRAYAPVIARRGAVLQIRGDWNDPTVNANASQEGSLWKIQMYGGLARRAEVTQDGFAMVIGHELGHHLGGFPTYPGQWAAAEGQSDYFATHAAAKLAWPVNSSPTPTPECVAFTAIPPNVLAKCSPYATNEERNLCYRTVIAATSLGSLLAALNFEPVPNIDTPDRTIVAQTNTSYPRTAQSRLDSMVNGGLCPIRWNDAVIPVNELQSVSYLCSLKKYPEYARPRSWFKPNL